MQWSIMKLLLLMHEFKLFYIYFKKFTLSWLYLTIQLTNHHTTLYCVVVFIPHASGKWRFIWTTVFNTLLSCNFNLWQYCQAPGPGHICMSPLLRVLNLQEVNYRGVTGSAVYMHSALSLSLTHGSVLVQVILNLNSKRTRTINQTKVTTTHNSCPKKVLQ